MPRQLLLEGPAIEPLLRQVREEHGESARVLKAERVRVGGVGGFFAKEKYEVTFEVDDAIEPREDRSGAAKAAPAITSVPASRARQGSAPGGPRGLAALLAAAEETERAAAATPGPDDSSPSAAALAAVREALASRAPAPPPLSTEKPAFTEVLDSVRHGLEGRSDRLAVPDDARALTGDRGEGHGDDPEADEERASALEQLRRALDALGVVDDTHEVEAVDETDETDETDEVHEAEGPERTEKHEHDGQDAEDGWLPDDQVWAEEVGATGDPEGDAGDPGDPEEPQAEEQRPSAHSVSLLQEMPRELVERAAADAAAPVEADVLATPDSPEPQQMTRRERRRAEEAERAAEPPEELPPVEEATPEELLFEEGPVDEAAPPEEEHDPVDHGLADEVHEASIRAVALPATLEELGEPHPHEPLPELPSVPAELMAAAAVAAFRGETPDTVAASEEDGQPGGERQPGQVDAPERPAEAEQPAAHEPSTEPERPEPSETPEQPEQPEQPGTWSAPLTDLHDRLARLGLHGRWLDGLPAEQASALRVIAERLSTIDVRPRRTPRASDHPVVAVLAEGTGAGLETARTLALGLGLRADQVVVLAAEDRRTARPGAEPLDRSAAARAAHAGRRHAQPVVVLVPVPFTPTPGERGAAAAALAALDADQVWAVVDATRRTSDAQAWLRAVGPTGGVDAVALVGLAATTAPADALELGAPVVLLDGQPATPVDWVATLAAHLTREDVEAHLAGLDRSAGPALGVEA